MGEVLGRTHQPCGRLRHGLQHKDTGQDGKGRKMIRQVLFREAYGLDSHKSLGRLEFHDAIDQGKFHRF
jgi:hypothetical protein